MTKPARTTDAAPALTTTPEAAPQHAPRAAFATPEEVADFLCLDTERLSKMRVAGTGPAFVRIDRSIRYAWRDVYRWLKQNTYISTKMRAEADPS